jgi:hypothetical protein
MENLLTEKEFSFQHELTKAFKVKGLNFLFLGIVATFIPALVFKVPDAPLIALLLYTVSRAFLKRDTGAVFTLAFGVYLISSAFFLLATNYTFGRPFLGGGDDMYFFIAAKTLVKAKLDINTTVDGIPMWASNYTGYLYLLGYYFKAISSLGFDSFHFYHLSLLKVCIGSFIPVLVFKIFKENKLIQLESSIWILVLFPTLVIHVVSLLREAVISVVFLFVVYRVIRSRWHIVAVLWVLFGAFLVYNIRPVHAVFVGLFYLIWVFLSRPKNLTLKLGGLVIVFFLLTMNWIKGVSLFGSDLDRIQGMYLALAQETNQEGSIGLRLYTSNFLLIQPLKLIYYFMSPIPPPMVIRLNLLSTYISLGIVFWYLYVFGFFSGYMNFLRKGDRLYLTVLLLFIISGIVGVVSSKDPRHLVYIYPLVIPFGYSHLQFIPKRRIQQIVITFLSLGVVGYLLLKAF